MYKHRWEFPKIRREDNSNVNMPYYVLQGVSSYVFSFSDQEVLVGREAVAQQETNAANTLYDAKRFIGKKFTAEELQKESSRYQFKVCDLGNVSSCVLMLEDTYIPAFLCDLFLRIVKEVVVGMRALQGELFLGSFVFCFLSIRCLLY